MNILFYQEYKLAYCSIGTYIRNSRIGSDYRDRFMLDPLNLTNPNKFLLLGQSL